MYYGSGALVIRRQNQYIETFNRLGAVDEKHAVSLETTGIPCSFIFKRMVMRGVFVQCADGSYYVDNYAAVRFKDQRREKGLILLAVLLAIAAVYYMAGGR